MIGHYGRLKCRKKQLIQQSKDDDGRMETLVLRKSSPQHYHTNSLNIMEIIPCPRFHPTFSPTIEQRLMETYLHSRNLNSLCLRCNSQFICIHQESLPWQHSEQFVLPSEDICGCSSLCGFCHPRPHF